MSVLGFCFCFLFFFSFCFFLRVCLSVCVRMSLSGRVERVMNVMYARLKLATIGHTDQGHGQARLTQMPSSVSNSLAVATCASSIKTVNQASQSASHPAALFS